LRVCADYSVSRIQYPILSAKPQRTAKHAKDRKAREGLQSTQRTAKHAKD
jgi:hypothetical protein